MRHESLVRNGDFARAYNKGKNWVHPHIVVYKNKNRVGYTRVGITTSKKVGNAVQRNRARRVIRAALAEVLPANVGGFDFVFVARGQTPRLKSPQLAKTLRALLQQAGVTVQPFPAAQGKDP